MRANKLKLNDSKTELFLISSPRHAAAVSQLGIDLKIGGSVITPSSCITNLGIVFDSNLNMKQHVSKLCRTVNFHIRNLWRIRRFIDRTTCAHAVRSLILSRLDYCNSLLGGLPKSDMQRLQRLQNRAARLVYHVDRRTSAAPLIRELHWLPVQQRVYFKILVHVYNCLQGSSPQYLHDLICLYTPGHAGLRSTHDSTRLVTPSTKRAYGDKCFSVLGPKLWNNLPRSLREVNSVQIFKKHLKTYLFPKY